MPTQFTQPTSSAWIEIDVEALRRNAVAIASRAGVPILPMVKADAYGHGAATVVRALEPLDPWGYGVATLAEGTALREAGIRRRVVVFTPLRSAELAGASAAGLTVSLHRAADIDAWRSLGGGAWHLAIDTGMGRAGVRWDDVASLALAVAECPPEGAYTHFHSADVDIASVVEQERRFATALAALPERPSILHTENSPTVMARGASTWNVVRPGLGLYGVDVAGDRLEPVAQIRARIVDLRSVRAGETVSYGATWRAERDSVIATVPCGYADGYRRHLSNRAWAMVNGRRVRVAGVVTMDMTMFDVTDAPCALDDVVTLLGRDGDEAVTALQLAACGGLSPYELLAGLRLRLPHVATGTAA